jgi:hypothetical protein
VPAIWELHVGLLSRVFLSLECLQLPVVSAEPKPLVRQRILGRAQALEKSISDSLGEIRSPQEQQFFEENLRDRHQF